MVYHDLMHEISQLKLLFLKEYHKIWLFYASARIVPHATLSKQVYIYEYFVVFSIYFLKSKTILIPEFN